MGQPGVPIGLRIPGFIPVDLAALDQWLDHTFGVSDMPAPMPMAGKATTIELTYRNLLARVGALACTFLQQMKIPSFDTGCVIRIDRGQRPASEVLAVLLVAGFDHYPPHIFRVAWQAALDLVLQALGHRFDPTRMAALVEQIHEGLLVPGRKQHPGGESTVSLLKAAHGLGIPHVHLGSGTYQLGWGNQARRFNRSAIDLDSAVGAQVSQDKVRTNLLLRRAGLPVPVGGIASDASAAVALAEALGYPVVVKPADRDRSEGVTVDIMDAAMVATAIKAASQFSSRLMVEKQISGVCHRILIADGELISVIRRHPKSVIGDGVHTVAELIGIANENNRNKPVSQRQTVFPNDETARQIIARIALSMDSIPAKERRVPLRSVETREWGGSPEYVTDQIHPDNVDIAVRAAGVLGLKVVGIDLISADISVPWHENGAAISELNFAPIMLGMSETGQRHIRRLLQRFFPAKGQIPVVVFVGDAKALSTALAWQGEQKAAGVLAYVTAHYTSFQPDGPMQMAFADHSLFLRCTAMLMNDRVAALALVVQTDELLSTGMPVDSIDMLSVVNTCLIEQGDAIRQLSTETGKALVRLLDAFVKNPPEAIARNNPAANDAPTAADSRPPHQSGQSCSEGPETPTDRSH